MPGNKYIYAGVDSCVIHNQAVVCDALVDGSFCET